MCYYHKQYDQAKQFQHAIRYATYLVCIVLVDIPIFIFDFSRSHFTIPLLLHNRTIPFHFMSLL